MSVALNEIRRLDEKFNRLKIESVYYEEKSMALSVVCLLCVHFDENDQFLIQNYLAKRFPFASVSVTIRKTVCDCDLVVKRILQFLADECKAVKGRINGSDISFASEEDCVTVTFTAEEQVCEYLQSANFEARLSGYLENFFCERFTYKFIPRKDRVLDDVLAEEKVDYSRIEQIPARYFTVNYVTRLFDNNPTDRVMYIADAVERTGEIAIAGKIIGIRERQTKKGKIFYIIDFNDGTGRMSGTVFSTKEIIRKMEKVQEGSEVVAIGNAEITEDGYHRFTISSLNLCELPKDFKYEEKASRKPPETYLVVKPEKVEQYKQVDLFDLIEVIPECLKGKTFVVFDFETTGTTPQEDKITEIGAVKIVDGKITEKFASMVNPERKIPEKVVELTGITDEMVADAPVFADIAGDLYKFCYGSILIAHNLAFDYAFVKNQSKQLNYV